MTNSMLLLPVIVPLLTGLLGIVWRRPSLVRRLLCGFSSLFQLIVALLIVYFSQLYPTLTLTIGQWKPPFGVVFVVDLFGALFLALSTLLLFIILIYMYISDGTLNEHPLLLPLLQFFMAGVALFFCVADVLTLFLAFSFILLSVFSLYNLFHSSDTIRSSCPFLIIHGVGLVLFMCFVGLCYATFGSLNFAEIAQSSMAIQGSTMLIILPLFCLLIFGLPAMYFPLYVWFLPFQDKLSYPMIALIGGIYTKIGVYGLWRFFTTIFPYPMTTLQSFLLVIALFTMVFGIISSLYQNKIKHVFSYLMISQLGVSLFSFSLLTQTSMTYSFFFIFQHSLAIVSLFLLGDMITRILGTDDINSGGGLWQSAPFLSLLFFVQSLLFIGAPPLSGFWGYLGILYEGIHHQSYIQIITILGVMGLSFFAMARVWFGCFWQENTTQSLRLHSRQYPYQLRFLTIIVISSVIIGLFPDQLMSYSDRAISIALDKYHYSISVFELEGLPRRVL